MKQLNLQTIASEEIQLEDARQLAIFHNGQVFTFFDEGCTRFVYVNSDMTKVLKMNKCSIVDANSEEFSIYENANEVDKSQMAVTKLLNRGFIEQQFVTPIKFGGRKLTEAQWEFANSCRKEVGWDSEGNLICFDLDEFKKY